MTTQYMKYDQQNILLLSLVGEILKSQNILSKILNLTLM